MVKEKCKADNCSKERYGTKDYCRKHYLQIKKYGRLTPELEVNHIPKGSICSIDGCDRTVYAKSVCRYHWFKQRGKNLIIKKELGDESIPSCKVMECNDIAEIKGYCKRHYNQVIKHGEVTLIEKRIKYPTVCQIEGCGKKSYSNGYCQSHYNKLYKYGDPLYEYKREKDNKCKIGDCDRKYYAKGYCRKHYLEYIMKAKGDKTSNRICTNIHNTLY